MLFLINSHIKDSMLIVGDWAPEKCNFVLDIPLSDYLFVNLEGPIFKGRDLPLSIPLKAGPILINENLPMYKNKVIYNLANNHFNDLGISVSFQTIKEIISTSSLFVGFGLDNFESRKPLIVDVHDRKVGIISFCETQFGESGLTKAGVANYGVWVNYEIVKLRKEVDYLIISSHFGVEDVPWPTPFIVDLYRSFIDLGANLVVGHHPHMPQGYENYKNGLIAYGLGNFAVNPTKWNCQYMGTKSLAIKLNFDITVGFTEEIITLEIQSLENGMYKITKSKDPHSELDSYFKLCNIPLSDRELLDDLWHHLSHKLAKSYALDFLYGPLSSIIAKTGFDFIKKQFLKFDINLYKLEKWLNKSNFVKNRLIHSRLFAYHVITCESHREILKYYFKNYESHSSSNCNKSISLLKSMNIS